MTKPKTNYFLVVILLLQFSIYEIYAQDLNISALKVPKSVVMDGKMDEDEWKNAIPFTGFKMVEPSTGIDPSEKTEIRVIYTESNLFIGINCYDSEPSKITANSKEHDKAGESKSNDQVSIIIDPFQNKRSGYLFICNPGGARSEGLATGEHFSLGWDGLWEAKSKINADGWSTEIRIPFKTISFKPGLSSWGFNVERYIARKQEVIRYSGINLNSFFSNPKEAGILEGIYDIEQGMGVTFRPYLIGAMDFKHSDTKLNSRKVDGGFDIYKNITPNLVAAVTYNTDFAETEVDERRLNLTRFPLYYPEKRTFFLEGSDIFEFGSTSSMSFLPFSSRRIGLNKGNPVPLIWGAKLFGKIRNTNIAMLNVQSDKFGDLGKQNLFAARISQNIFDESRIGAILTHGSPSGKQNILGGLDFKYKTSRFLGDDNFSVDLWGVKNQNEAKSGNKNGYGFKMDYPNDLIDAAISYTFFGDSINPELGFLPRKGYKLLTTAFSYMPRPEKGIIGQYVRQWYFQARYTNYRNMNGRIESRKLYATPVSFRTESGERIEFTFIPTFESLPHDFEVSENVIIPKGDYRFTNYHVELRTASYRKIEFDFGYSFGQFYSGTYSDIETEITLKMNGLANLQVGANFVRGNLKEGKFDENVWFTKLNLYLTPDLGMSNFLQFDNVSNLMGYNGRIFWQITPGNTIYFVYNNVIARQLSQISKFRSLEEQIRFKIQTSIRF